MPALDRAELVLEATINGSSRTGTFVFLGGEKNSASISEVGRTGYLIGGGRGTQLLGAISELLDADELKRKDLRLDFGGGQHVHELSFDIAKGATDADGNDYQWGSSSNPNDGPNAHTATGADPRTQAQVFMNYWRVGTHDSRTSATFRWWEYSSGGILDELEVGIESPKFDIAAGDPAVSGSMTLIDTESLDTAGTSDGNTTT